MRRTAILVIVLLAIAGYLQVEQVPRGGVPAPSAVEPAFSTPASGAIIEVRGVVERLLRDDNEGSRHQRFIIRVDRERTLLVSHNIDVAPRVSELEVGDEVEVKGEYEWNDQGGLVHWTHHDPVGRHESGWIRHVGREYR